MSTLIVRLAGSRWLQVPSPNTNGATNSLTSVACSQATSCVAVGGVTGATTSQRQAALQQGYLIEVQSRSKWHLGAVHMGSHLLDDSLTSVSCPTHQMCLAVGQSVVRAGHIPSGPIHAYAVRISR